jgi:2-hydroxychromene-2-carboxylate isomerase
MSHPLLTIESSKIEFWFEFASNYSYLSVMRIEEAARQKDVSIIWKPFLLGPIFRALGMENSPFVLQKEKGAYVWRDMERQCHKYGLQWRQPTTFPRNALLPLRVALLGEKSPGSVLSAAGSWNATLSWTKTSIKLIAWLRS